MTTWILFDIPKTKSFGHYWMTSIARCTHCGVHSNYLCNIGTSSLIATSFSSGGLTAQRLEIYCCVSSFYSSSRLSIIYFTTKCVDYLEYEHCPPSSFKSFTVVLSIGVKIGLQKGVSISSAITWTGQCLLKWFVDSQIMYIRHYTDRSFTKCCCFLHVRVDPRFEKLNTISSNESRIAIIVYLFKGIDTLLWDSMYEDLNGRFLTSCFKIK